MNLYNRNLLILFNTRWLDDKVIEQKTECINAILSETFSTDKFCSAFELVNRNRITNKQKILLKESKHLHLRPFRFLINKN